MSTTAVTPVPAAAPAPTAMDNLLTVLQHFGLLLQIFMPIALAATAPFVKSTSAQAIEAAEAPVAEAAAQTLASL